MEDQIAASPVPDSPPPPGSRAEPVRRWRNLELREAARRRRALAVAAMLAIATVAALVATVGWFRPIQRPALLLLGDASELGSIPYAEQDVRALASLGAFFPVEGPTSIDRGMDSLKADETLGSMVVYVSARAWAEPMKDDASKTILRFSKEGVIPPPGQRAEGSSLDELIGSIASSKAARKLLILDIHPPPDDPRLGAAGVDVGSLVVDAADKAVEANSNAQLSILVSCGAGQRPASSEALGRSVFGYYVERGLRGDADTSGDGRVTVRELAAFVERHVDRWTSRVLLSRQTPTSFETQAQVDFPVALVDRRLPRPQALVDAKEVPAYPQWLIDGWRERDAARKAGVDREAPRVFEQIEAALQLAERDWRGMLDEARVRADLSGRLGTLRDRIAPTRAIPHPRPRSLAQELAFGAVPDPDLLKGVREVAAKRAVPTPESKPGEVAAANSRLIADFASSARVKSDFDLADAVFRVASEDQAPGRDLIVFLDRLLASRQPRPLYVETLALHHLAGLPPPSWSPETARLALALVVRGEALQARPASLFGTTARLDDADRLRHEAEALLASPDFARPGEVNRRLNEALAATDSAAAGASTVEQARLVLDQAMGILPVTTPLVAIGDIGASWLAAADSAGGLADLLAKGAGEGSARPLDGLAERVDTLRGSLVPFGSKAIAARVERLTRPAAVLGAADLREIEALIATPLPLAEQRAALWKVGIDLERSLAGATLALDARSAAPIVDAAAESNPRRVDVSAALLGMAGPEPGGWAGLVGFVLGNGPSAEQRDRASRLVSPWVASPALDDPATDPTRLRRLDEFVKLRRWLTARYTFESHDPDFSEFFAEASSDFDEPGGRARPSLAIEAVPASAGLDLAHPETLIRLKLRSSSPSGPARVEFATADDDLLDVRAGSSGPKSAARVDVPLEAGSADVPLTISLRSDSDATTAPIPPGVLVRVRWAGRTYHRRIPLRIEPESRRPRLIFAASPTGPVPAASEVRLRAAQGKVGYSIFVQNPGDRDRKFAVELGDRRGAIAGASATLTVKPGEASRVSFGPPPANPDAGVVELLGPLIIRLTDLEDPKFRIARTIPVGLAPPSDYVRVISSHYDPPGSAGVEKSRLEFRLKLVEPIAGAPCPVELSLPVDRIPGLLSSGVGTFRSKLEKLDDEVVLFIEDFGLDPRGDEGGYVHLAIDGIERALVYRTRFTRRGAPTIPIRDDQPRVRLKAGRVASTSAPLKVDVELDSPPEAGKLELSLGRYTATGLDDRFRADFGMTIDPSRGRVRLNPRGPDGSLVFEATVRDSSVTFDVGKVRGRRIVRALLKDERGDLRDSDELPLVLDDRPPTAVAFDSPPRYGLKGGTVTLRASGKEPDSGIKEVVFFAGRPLDGKRPAGVSVVQGRPVGSGREAWSGALPLVDAKLGPLEVSVEFVSGAGPSQFDTATIAVVDSIPVEPGKIKGVVREGPRPQPGLEVRVYDDKNAEKGKATTDESGQFEVANLAPGIYEIVSAKPTPPTRGTAKVSVQAGSTAEAEVPLFRVIR